MTEADKALSQMSQVLQTMKDVGLALVAMFIIILVVFALIGVVVAFVRRSSSADAQVAKANAVSDRLATALDNATTAFKGIEGKMDNNQQFNKQYTEEQTKALIAVRDVITSFQTSATASDTKLSQQVTGVSDLLSKLLAQGDEALAILREIPGEHSSLEGKLDEFLKNVRRDPTLQTSEMNRASSATLPVQVTVSQLPIAPVPEPN